MTVNKQLPAESFQGPTYYEGQEDLDDGVSIGTRYFTAHNQHGLEAGTVTSVMFTIARPAKDIWPYFMDFNLWQKGHYYSEIIGAAEGKTFRLSAKPNEAGRHQYQVLRVIPETLIVLSQPVPQETEGTGDTYLPGLGIVSPGFHVFLLNEHGGRTVVNCVMQHASLMEHASRSQGMTNEEALRPWRAESIVPEWLRKWRDEFIPSLKRLVEAQK